MDQAAVPLTSEKQGGLVNDLFCKMFGIGHHIFQLEGKILQCRVSASRSQHIFFLFYGVFCQLVRVLCFQRSLISSILSEFKGEKHALQHVFRTCCNAFIPLEAFLAFFHFTILSLN